MKSTKKEARTRNKILLIGIVLFFIISLIFLVSALTDDEKVSLQAELDNLTSYLNDNNYGWLVDYNLSYSSIEVYRENSDEVIAVFENILEENWYKIYLTNLGENESYSTFDLRSVGDIEKINYDILQKKMRIDEIRKELNNYEVKNE